MEIDRNLITSCLLVLVLCGCSLTANDPSLIGTAVQASYFSESGSTIQAAYLTDQTVRLKFSNNSTLILPIAASGSGARYADDRYEWWEHHGEGRYSVDGKVVFLGRIRQ